MSTAIYMCHLGNTHTSLNLCTKYHCLFVLVYKISRESVHNFTRKIVTTSDKLTDSQQIAKRSSQVKTEISLCSVNELRRYDYLIMLNFIILICKFVE